MDPSLATLLNISDMSLRVYTPFFRFSIKPLVVSGSNTACNHTHRKGWGEGVWKHGTSSDRPHLPPPPPPAPRAFEVQEEQKNEQEAAREKGGGEEEGWLHTTRSQGERTATFLTRPPILPHPSS